MNISGTGHNFEGAKNLLLITATIAPAKNMPSNALVDTDERLSHYAQALRSYLSFAPPYPDQILFCENSGYDLEPLREIARNENPHNTPVHFWSFQAEAAPELGKGYGELEILDRAYDEFLVGLSESTVVWKMTGRLVVKNLGRLLKSRPDHARFYIDMRKLPFMGPRGSLSHYADTRIIGYTPNAYKELLYEMKNGQSWVNEGHIFDRLYAASHKDKTIVPRFRVQPVVKGIDGTLLKDYEGFSQKFKNNTRSVMRKIAPWIWV